MFAVVAILAVPFAYIAKERRQSIRECEIAAELVKQGWECGFGGPYDSYTPLGEVDSKGVWCELARLLLGQRVYKAYAPQQASTSTAFHATTNLSRIARFTNLRELYVSNTHVRDLSPLVRLKKLEVLYVENTPVSDLTPLSDLTNLKYLFIRHTQVSDLSPLAGLTDLGCFYLSNTPVSDLRPVAGLKKLWRLYFDRCPVGDEQTAMIRAALPECKIVPFP